MKLAIVILASILLCSAAYGQDSLRFRYGFEGGISVNMHTADFRALPGVPNCCPQFTTGSGIDPFIGIGAAWPLSQQLLFSLGLNYVDQSANLEHDETIAMIVNGTAQSGTDEHTVNATLRSIGIEPTLSYRLFAGAFIDAGVRIGYMMTKQYSQEERIVTSAGTFLDSLGNDTHSQVRDQNSGTIPQANALIAQLIGGIRYELPLNAKHTMFLVPSLAYAASLTNISSVDWKPNGLRVGIGITFSPVKDNRGHLYDTIFHRDTSSKLNRDIKDTELALISSDRASTMTSDDSAFRTMTVIREHYLLQIPDRHDVSCSVAAFGLEDDSTEHPIATLKIEEFLSMNAHPLLGYVFFADGDSTIPARYHLIDKSETAAFNLQSLFSLDALGVNHNGLNIIAYRLRQHPDAHLTITGCNENVGIEEGNQSLSNARARTIYNYLHNVWNIPESQMSIVARDLPERPSNPRTPIGQEENRRVELTCDQPEVLDVFLASDTTRIPDPPQLRIKMKTISSVGIASWNLDITQGGKLLHRAEGQGDAPDVNDWDITHDYAAIPHYDVPLHFVLRTVNAKGDVAEDSVVLPTQILTIEQKKARHKGDVVIDKYNLVLFEFGRSAMLPAHQRILNMVQSRLKPNSIISVDGYTDRSGTPAGNRKLATDRATSSAKGLGRKDATIKGIGDARLLYPNDTPEGRFLCRTVQITVKTPVE